MIKRVFLVISAFLLLVGLGNTANAQDEASVSSRVSQVDATGDAVKISLVSLGGNLDPGSVVVNQDGSSIAISDAKLASAAGSQLEVAVILDVHQRSKQSGTFDGVKSELASVIEGLPSDASVKVYSAGSTASAFTETNYTASKAAETIRNLSTERESSIYDSINLASDGFSANADTVKSIILYTSGPDTSNSNTSAANYALTQNGIQLFVAHSGSLDSDLNAMVDNSAGFSFSINADEPAEEFNSTFSTASERSIITVQATADTSERLNLSVVAGTDTHEISYVNGRLLNNSSEFEPLSIADTSKSFFENKIVLYAAILFAALAIGFGVWTVASSFVTDSSLEGVLSGYMTGSDPEQDYEDALIQTSIIQRAVSATETFAEKRGFLERVGSMLERADLPIRPGELLFLAGAGNLLIFGLVFVVSKSVIMAVVFLSISTAISFFALQFMGRRRLKKFEAQLPDTLHLLAGTLKAGYSLPQGLEAVSKEIANPMSSELARAMSEARLGRDLEESLSGVADRLDSPDFSWAVMAMGIQREVGGNLNELLVTVADTMTQRERLRREVSALTAEGRMSAGLLAFMPPAIAMAIWIINPGYLNPLLTQNLGRAMLGAGIFAIVVGIIWMKKAVTIDA